MASGAVFTAQATSLLGIYESRPAEERSGDKSGNTNDAVSALASLPLTPDATQAHLAAKPAIDPKDACQVLGPFRVMARSDTRFEILRDAPDKFVLLFQQSSWGHVRTIRMAAQHIDFAKIRPMWNGDSIGRWEGETLVIETVHFTDKTWLNEMGVTNSKQLVLTERLHLVNGGKDLAYQATAVDPAVLVHPVTYTRAFKRSTAEIVDDNCFDHRPARGGNSRPVPGQ